MATLYAVQSFDVSNLNFNRLIANQVEAGFQDNVFLEFNSVVYEDIAYFQHYSGGYVNTAFGGRGVVFDVNGNVTGGTLTGVYEEYWDGYDWQQGWWLEGFSYSAVALASAVETPGGVDDFVIVQQILAGGDRINLSDFADKMTGYGGNDSIFGFGGNDTLLGDAGNDSLDGGTGADQLFGGAGNDIYRIDNPSDRVYETATTTSTVNLGGSDTVQSSVTFALPSFVEGLVLVGSSPISGTGNGLSNKITGNGANNTLAGGSGNDTLSGGSGSDRLDGGAGNDSLVGGSGNDALIGGSGNDKLDGGVGNDGLTSGTGLDTFRFSGALNSTANVDRLVDFSVVDDRLEFESSIFTKLTATGVLSASNFRANVTGTASDANDYVVYDTDGGQLFYDADGNGAGTKVLIATLVNLAALTNADIFVT